jgi:hypothetical protein
MSWCNFFWLVYNADIFYWSLLLATPVVKLNILRYNKGRHLDTVEDFTVTENQLNDNRTVTYTRIFDTAIQSEGQLTSGHPAYDTAFRKHSSS